MTTIPFELKINDFLAIKEGELSSKNPLTVLVAPNRGGKTQILYLLYAIFRGHWKASRWTDSKEIEQQNLINTFLNIEELSDVFLFNNNEDYVNWNAQNASVNLKDRKYFDVQLDFSKSTKSIRDEFPATYPFQKSPIYLSPAGIGDFYKGIKAIVRFYPDHKIISSAITDFLDDLFIVEGNNASSTINLELLESFQAKFGATPFIQNNAIQIQEGKNQLPIEQAASGLKSLSWLYLMIKHDLLGEVLFLDEPEVNLHPLYQDKLAAFIGELIKSGVKVFLSTHSDYLLESINKNIHSGTFKADVWQGTLTETGAAYNGYEANTNQLIDTMPLNEIYVNTMEALFKNQLK